MKSTIVNRMLSLQAWPATRYMDQEEIKAVARVLEARSPFRYYGPNLQHEVTQFEAELAQFVGTSFCLGVASGSAALQAAVAALGVGPGDEVVVPGYLWVATVASVVNNGAIPVLADVDDSLSLDPDDLERKLTPRTKAVIVVHLGGVIGKIERVAAICKARSVPLLEDCAQSLGASKFGIMAGRFGDIAIFSFQLNKNCTAGEGGAIVTNDEALFKKATAIHDLGYLRDPSGAPLLNDNDHQLWGLGSRMSELTAAILRVQLRRLPSLVEEMRMIKSDLVEIARPYRQTRCVTAEDREGDSGSLLTLLFEDNETARRFQQRLFVSAMRITKQFLGSFLLMDYGLHLYYQNKSLVKKKAICGHHSVWELAENGFSRHYSYEKGTLPVLDSLATRALLFATPVGLTTKDRDDLRLIFQRTHESAIPNE